MPTHKAILSACAIGLTLYLFLPYIRSIRAGVTRPHVFSWVVWGVGTLIVFFAQLAGGSGVGAWAIGVSGVITVYVAFLAWQRRGDTRITAVDWGFLLAALGALPLWFFTQDPLWAVVVLTTVDLLGFGPTFRKAYRLPHEENATFFALSALRNLLVILALERYTLTTLLFPGAVGLGCLLLVVLLLARRRTLGPGPGDTNPPAPPPPPG